jgi:hypothetical protein
MPTIAIGLKTLPKREMQDLVGLSPLLTSVRQGKAQPLLVV